MKKRYGLKIGTGVVGICFLLGLGGCGRTDAAAKYVMSAAEAVQAGTEEAVQAVGTEESLPSDITEQAL